MNDFIRFPHTPHIAWLGAEEPRDDKLLSDAEIQDLLAGEVVVEEKVDGANLGISTTENGDLRVQNRGAFLEREHAHPQFRPLWSWLPARETALTDALWPDLLLFGEWCHAVHTVEYDRLPDWFLGFDVFDREEQAFWDTARRDAMLSDLGLHPVPLLAEGQFSLAGLQDLLGSSRLSSGPMEGLVVRRESGGQTVARGKLVRAEFTQAIDEHWSRRPLRRNTLAAGAHSWP